MRIGCVSYLNAKPLIDGIESVAPEVPVRFDVPSGLLADLESGEVDLALCPVIDYFRSRVPLTIVPAGGIGCDGPTLTVRLYSTGPLDAVEQVHADTDSHTSVALLRVLMLRMFGRHIEVIDFNAREHVAGGQITPFPPAMLLIGDKVVTDSPPAVRYPHQLDLGEAWKALTGLPFVFAVWMAGPGAALDQVPRMLASLRERNASRLAEIVARYAPGHGWPLDLAQQYLGELLKFEIGPRQIEAIRRFGDEAAAAGVIPAAQPLRLHASGSGAPVVDPV
jgi:chorismate dehydratase